MEPGDYAGGASEHLAVDTSLPVEYVSDLVPHVHTFEPSSPGTDDEDSVCVLEPRHEVVYRAQEAANAERQRMREMADAMYSAEWIAAVHMGVLAQNYQNAAEARAASSSRDQSDGAFADRPVVSSAPVHAMAPAPAPVDEPAPAPDPAVDEVCFTEWMASIYGGVRSQYALHAEAEAAGTLAGR